MAQNQDNPLQPLPQNNQSLKKNSDSKELDKLLQQVPSNVRERIGVLLKQQQQVQVSQFTGPIPPPEIMRQYADISPNFPERIFKSFEEQSRHRIQMESAVIPHREKLAARGQLFAFILGVLIVICGTYCILKDFAWAGATIITSAVGGLAIAFLTGKSAQAKDLAQKRPQ